MMDFINQIEKFLRGQMSEKEEVFFKTSLTTDEHLRSQAFIVAYILKKQKTW